MNEPTEYVLENGTRKWMLENGVVHRDDGPAIIWDDGSLAWYQHDKLHRPDGPARILMHHGGTKIWWQEWWRYDLHHREDGPATIWDNGRVDWFLRNVHISDQVNDWISVNDLPDWSLWDDEIKTLFRLKFS